MTPLIAHELARPDATIRYRASPEPVSSSAPTLVLLHGATLDHRAWDVQVAALQESWHRCTGQPLPANVHAGVEHMIRESGSTEG